MFSWPIFLRRAARYIWLLPLAVLLQSCTLIQAAQAQPAPARTAADAVIYDDALAAGWADWSWDTTVNLASNTPVHGGAAAISARFDAAWAGFYLHAEPAIPLAGYTHLRFWLHGGAQGGQRITIMANQNAAATVEVSAQANNWTQHSISLADLGSPATLTDLFWQDATGSSQPVFYLDDISLVGSSTPPTTTITLTIDAARQRRPISPYIYGMNFAPEALADELDLPINRWGGNSTSRYNYQTDISNHAFDWYFQNIKETDATSVPDDSWANRFVDQNERTGTQSLLTLPMSGWVANGVDRACGYDVNKYGAQQEVDPYPPHRCGNGVRTDGSRITGNDPLDTSLAAPPSFTAGWVDFLKGKYGAAEAGGVRFYDLDNEPDIWYETHRDVKLVGWKYQEFRDATVAYAAAVKAADPGALLLGPVVNGWTYYWHGAYDAQREDWSTPDDRLANGDIPFVPWYLQQMRQYETDNSVRLLDYLDLHYYPQASGVALAEDPGSPATQALRLRSTRGLWDPTYVDESWIAGAGPEGGIVQLIPRMRAWVEQYYPDTKLAVTEYNWGALGHINGALAQAEVLGIFGREGLDLATLWAPPEADQPGAFAFRIYRNYDGAGSRFGDTSVQATSADAGQLSIFAAQRSSDGALTAVVINKTDGPLTGALAVANAALSGGGEWRRYSAADLTRITPPTSFTLVNGAAELTFPAQSITLLVMGTEMETGDERLYLPTIRSE